MLTMASLKPLPTKFQDFGSRFFYLRRIFCTASTDQYRQYDPCCAQQPVEEYEFQCWL